MRTPSECPNDRLLLPKLVQRLRAPRVPHEKPLIRPAARDEVPLEALPFECVDASLVSDEEARVRSRFAGVGLEDLATRAARGEDGVVDGNGADGGLVAVEGADALELLVFVNPDRSGPIGDGESGALHGIRIGEKDNKKTHVIEPGYASGVPLLTFELHEVLSWSVRVICDTENVDGLPQSDSEPVAWGRPIDGVANHTALSSCRGQLSAARLERRSRRT